MSMYRLIKQQCSRIFLVKHGILTTFLITQILFKKKHFALSPETTKIQQVLVRNKWSQTDLGFKILQYFIFKYLHCVYMHIICQTSRSN